MPGLYEDVQFVRNVMFEAQTEPPMQHVALHCNEEKLVIERAYRVFCFLQLGATSSVCPNISLHCGFSFWHEFEKDKTIFCQRIQWP